MLFCRVSDESKLLDHLRSSSAAGFMRFLTLRGFLGSANYNFIIYLLHIISFLRKWSLLSLTFYLYSGYFDYSLQCSLDVHARDAGDRHYSPPIAYWAGQSIWFSVLFVSQMPQAFGRFHFSPLYVIFRLSAFNSSSVISQLLYALHYCSKNSFIFEKDTRLALFCAHLISLGLLIFHQVLACLTFLAAWYPFPFHQILHFRSLWPLLAPGPPIMILFHAAWLDIGSRYWVRSTGTG